MSSAPVGLVGAPLGAGFGDAGPLRPRAGAAAADAAADRPLRRRDRARALDARSPTAATSSVAGLTIEQATGPIREAVAASAAQHALTLLVGGNNAVTRPGVLGLGMPLDKVGLITLDAHFDMRDTRRGPQQRQSRAGADRGRAAGRQHRADRPRQLRQQPRRCTRMRSPPAISSSPSARCAANGIAAAIDRALDARRPLRSDRRRLRHRRDRPLAISRRARRAARRHGGRTISSPRSAGSRPIRGCG